MKYSWTIENPTFYEKYTTLLLSLNLFTDILFIVKSCKAWINKLKSLKEKTEKPCLEYINNLSLLNSKC